MLFLTARSASEFITQLHEQLYEQDEGAQEQGQTFQSHILKDCCKDCETAFQPFPTPLRTGPLAALLPIALESFALLISMPWVLADLCSMLPSPERHVCGRRPQIFFCSAHTQLRSSICLGKKQGDGNMLGVQVRKQRAWQNTTALLLTALQQPPRGLISSTEPRPYKTAGTF